MYVHTLCSKAAVQFHLPSCALIGAPRDDTIAQWRLAGRFRGGEIAQGRACAVWLQVDAPELSSGPIWEIQEVSRVGAQGVTSKSKLLAREMPRVCSRGLRVDSGESLRRKVAVRGQAPKSDGRCALPGSARAEVLRVRHCHPEPADVLVSVEVTNPVSKPLELCTEV